MAALIAWFQANSAMVLGILLALSEALALIPGIKSNSVFQLVFNFLKSLVKKSPAP